MTVSVSPDRIQALRVQIRIPRVCPPRPSGVAPQQNTVTKIINGYLAALNIRFTDKFQRKTRRRKKLWKAKLERAGWHKFRRIRFPLRQRFFFFLFSRFDFKLFLPCSLLPPSPPPVREISLLTVMTIDFHKNLVSVRIVRCCCNSLSCRGWNPCNFLLPLIFAFRALLGTKSGRVPVRDSQIRNINKEATAFPY